MSPMDLQLFAEERTERATPRRREQARRKGRVFRSLEVTSAAVLLVGFAGLGVMGSQLLGRLEETMVRFLGRPPAEGLTVASVVALSEELARLLAVTALPLAGLAFAAGIAANLAQVGFVVTLEPLVPNLGRLDPAAGLARILSRRSLLELGKAVIKVVAVGWVTYSAAREGAAELPALLEAEPRGILATLGRMVTVVVLRAGLVLAALAVADYLYQRWEHESTLRMTRHEVKEEFKEVEGHPQTRARIRQKQQQLASRRMMAEVPGADVVVTNPVHYAVALRYDAERMPAPRVVAKGRGPVAERIRELARESGVALVENPPLAQALYKAVDVGGFIPEELYQAVAEVLAFVYRLRLKAQGRR